MTEKHIKWDKAMSVTSKKKNYGDETSALLKNLCKLTTSYLANNKKQEFLDCYEAPTHYDTRKQVIERLSRAPKY